MLARLKSFGLTGINGYPVSVETDISNGMPSFELIGQPDTAIKECKERVRSAVRNSGMLFPPARITVNLAPADTKKAGASYDLAIALGILAATEQVDYRNLADAVFLGELSLGGEVKPVRGVLPLLIAAKGAGFTRAVVPYGNAAEAAYIEGVSVYPVKTLKEAAGFAEGFIKIPQVETVRFDAAGRLNKNYPADFKYVKGQTLARRALEIAAAGGHNALMIGPPGAGKTMLAKCLPSILPAMTAEEALETTKIHSVAGVLDPSSGIINARPFRTPHHTATRAAMAGGSARAVPGEISLAHNGVLFLDELPEFPRSVVEVLRQPLEDGVIGVNRAAAGAEYPADFMLVASMNPCPCGNYGSKIKPCRCSSAQIHKYMSRVSGPMLDRIDLHIEVGSVTYGELSGAGEGEDSAAVRERVDAARAIQNARYKEERFHNNSKIGGEPLKKYCALSPECEGVIKNAFEKLNLSARAYVKILKVARTIADLAGGGDIKPVHILEAVRYRSLDGKYWN